MEKKNDYDLDTICDSVIFGKPLTEAEDKKDKDNDNPFADTSKSDDEEKKDDSSDDSGDSSESDDTGDSSDNDNPFGGGSEDESSDDSSDDKPASDDDEADENGVGAPMDEGKPEDDSPAEVSTEGYSDVMDFGIELMMLGVQSHFWHINAKTSGEHDLLEELYHRLYMLADRVLENVISVTKTSVTAGSELSFDFGDLEFHKEEIVGILEDVRAEADDLVSRYQDNQGLCTIMGDVSEALSTAIYKLTRFDTNETL